ncbi:MAG: MoxR family ATPase [Microthrixaceae bacterium]|nr:MoxR family ATPase [Microthrixaceae bacterium]
MSTDGVTKAPAPTEFAGRLADSISSTLRGKPEAVRLALATLLSGGHLLLEDMPGTGKTLLSRAIAASIGGSFGRVQCTPDLLPSDITGTSVFRPDTAEWEFRAGPLFSNVLLVDEINRASPRTQSALLQPMEERHLSIDGRTWSLPEPFFCVATQNPYGQVGTFPLPESQLDRFALSMSLGLPDRAAEREVLSGIGGTAALEAVGAVTQARELQRAIEATAGIWCAEAILDYVLDLVDATRASPHLGQGATPRASVGLVRLARGHAVVSGRDHVTPDDVQAVFVGATAHRVLVGDLVDPRAAREVLAEVLATVPVPRP